MSALNLYDVTIPQLTLSLNALNKILRKAASEGPSLNPPLDPSTIPTLRLTEDMLPFTSQIQIATNAAKFVAVRVGGVENVEFPDTETTLDELIARIDRTVEFLGKVKREEFEGKETKEVMVRDFKFGGVDYVNQFALPNFYFHVTVAYSLLRMKGLDIGKKDYLGDIFVKA